MQRDLFAGRKANAALFALAGSVLLSLPLVGPSRAAPVKEGESDKGRERKTVTYDVADIAEREPGGVDHLVLMLLRVFEPEEWRKGANTLQVVNEAELVVHAPAELHEQLAQYLEALRRKLDAAVLVEGRLYGVDADLFKTKVQPLLARQGEEKSRDELLELLSTRATLVESGRAKIHDRHEGRFFSLRQAYLYKRWSEAGFAEGRQSEAYELGFHGVTYKARVFVSSNRLRVHLRLSEQVTELQEMGSAEDWNLRTGKKESVDFPRAAEKTTTFPAVAVEDGSTVVRHLSWKPREAGKGGREMVLVVRPVIYIEEEERERQKQASGKE